MARSALLDRGRERMLIYPEVSTVNARGDEIRIPSTTPVEIRVIVTAQRQGDSEIAGQVSIKMLYCITRSAPVDSWAKIFFRGEEWDLASPPHFSVGLSRNLDHVEFIIRSRNKIGD